MSEYSELIDRIPAPLYRATSVSFDIDYIVSSKQEDRYPDCQYFVGDWLFRFKIPPFQRSFVWTEEQCVRFIESAYLGFSLGTYLVNKVENWVKLKRDRDTPNEGKTYIHEYDDYLIDGQQRITAIKKYVDNEFPVFGLYWKDLNRKEQYRFKNVEFPLGRVFLTDIDKLHELYDRLNFGGTAHTEDQRASKGGK
jgi:uncharacterized protein with ParB-like and HNH nuclease domain